MSRIGKKAVSFGTEVSAQVSPSNELLLSKGNRSLKVKVHPEIKIVVKEGQVCLERKNEEQKFKAFHGLYRSLIQNAVIGLSKGWSKSLQFNGVGYKAVVSGEKLELNLGYSHPIVFKIPKNIEIKVEKQTKVHITGADKQQVGQVAAYIRSLRPLEPYLGKGVRYTDEVVRKKAGKSGAEKKQ